MHNRVYRKPHALIADDRDAPQSQDHTVQILRRHTYAHNVTHNACATHEPCDALCKLDLLQLRGPMEHEKYITIYMDIV